MAAGNVNFDTLASLTLKNYQPRIADHLRDHEALWWQLGQRGHMKQLDGGLSIVEPVMFRGVSNASTYAGYDILDTTPINPATAAEFEWKQSSSAVSISGQEIVKNAGKSKVIDLLSTKIRYAETDLKLLLNSQILTSDGSGNGGKDFNGFAVAIEEAVGGAWKIGRAHV